MIGLDTNVIVRYLTQDDPIQSAKATKLIERLSSDSPGFISVVSIVELVWVLQACYDSSRQVIAHMLQAMLQTEELIVERPELIWKAFRRFQGAGQADFADCLIECCAAEAGCEYTITFDKNAAKTVGMKMIG